MSEWRDRLDVNLASRADLIGAGVYPVVANRILRHRDEHGPIRDENELYQVVRDNQMRLDQLLTLVRLNDSDEVSQGYST